MPLNQKHKKILDLFAQCRDADSKYEKIIKLGSLQSKNDFDYKKDTYLVDGCQSKLYLYSYLQDGKVFFKAHSDALISAGLAELLVNYFSGETPEVILKNEPIFLNELGIPNSLTPTRANGLANVLVKIKQEALKYYMQLSSA